MNDKNTYISEKVRNSDNVVINPSTEERQEEMLYTLQLLLDSLQFGNKTAPGRTLRVQLDPDLTHNLGTLTNVTNVNNMLNILRQGDLQMQRINEAQLDAAYISGVYNNLIL